MIDLTTLALGLVSTGLAVVISALANRFLGRPNENIQK